MWKLHPEILSEILTNHQNEGQRFPFYKTLTKQYRLLANRKVDILEIDDDLREGFNALPFSIELYEDNTSDFLKRPPSKFQKTWRLIKRDLLPLFKKYYDLAGEEKPFFYDGLEFAKWKYYLLAA